MALLNAVENFVDLIGRWRLHMVLANLLSPGLALSLASSVVGVLRWQQMRLKIAASSESEKDLTNLSYYV